MLPRPVQTVAAVLCALLAAGCTGQAPPDPQATAQPAPTGALTPRTQLAGLAAAAKDRRFMAGYALSQPGRPARTVAVTVAVDGTWRVDVPGGALGGQADVGVAGTKDGLYQCRLGASTTVATGCVKVAQPGGAVPVSQDPRIEHPFTDWLDVLTDRQAALSVAPAAQLPGSRGTCFSVEPTAAALVAPIDAGVYCYDKDGTLTAVRAGFGTLVLATAVSPGPPTVTLPGPVMAGTAMPTAAPSPSASASPSSR